MVAVPARPEPVSALADVIKAAQRMLVARIDLASVQARDTVQAVALVGGATLIAAFGWVLLMGALVTALDDVIPLPLALAIIGVVHVGAAVAVALVGRSAARPGRSTLEG